MKCRRNENGTRKWKYVETRENEIMKMKVISWRNDNNESNENNNNNACTIRENNEIEIINNQLVNNNNE